MNHLKLPEVTERTDALDELQGRADRLGMPWVLSLPSGALDPALIHEVPVDWARANCVLPVRLDQGLCALVAEPEALDRLEYLSLLLDDEVQPVLAPRELILQSIEHCYYSKEDSPDTFLQTMDMGSDRVAGAEDTSADLLRASRETPVTQLVNLILLEAVKRGASDVHFEPFETRLRVRYRIDGVLYEQTSPPKHLEESLISRLKVMGKLDIAEKRLPQDGMAKVRIGDREIDIRLSTVPVAEGERVVLRLLDRDSALLPLSHLGMPDSMLQGMLNLLTAPNGMVLISGPTGSGKTTTLYAALSNLDATRKNILTIEDPIEYQLDNIGQIQVKPKIGLTFASGLRHALRQDPDVILVGETRDIETAEIAIRSSLTGHLVFTTLHTNDAIGSIGRLLDMGVEPFLLASCLRGVLAQRLVRTLCPHCRKSMHADASVLKDFGAYAGVLAGSEVWEPVGCEKCLEGYRGRTGVFELLTVDQDLRSLIRRGFEGRAEHVLPADHRSLVDDAIVKMREGRTSLSEVATLVSG